MSERFRRLANIALATVAVLLMPVGASAQDDASGGLLRNNLLVVGVVIVVVVLIVVLSRRMRPAAPQSAASDESSAEPESEELAATTFSAMGLMSNAGGPLRGEYFVIKQTGLTIGRDPSTCDVVYDDSTVSREHARLEYTSDGLVVRNLSDMNQTFLNDEAITEASVKAGDRIRIENLTFKVLPHGASG